MGNQVHHNGILLPITGTPWYSSSPTSWTGWDRGGTRIAGCFILWEILLKWMMTGGTPISGTSIYVYLSWFQGTSTETASILKQNPSFPLFFLWSYCRCCLYRSRRIFVSWNSSNPRCVCESTHQAKFCMWIHNNPPFFMVTFPPFPPKKGCCPAMFPRLNRP